MLDALEKLDTLEAVLSELALDRLDEDASRVAY